MVTTETTAPKIDSDDFSFPGDIMQVHFFDSYPYAKLDSQLKGLIQGARRIDAAVAFVTHPGIAIMRQYLKSRGPGNGRLVASVRFPTDLGELANLEEDSPGTVFLHTGYQKPQEDKADRGQFHSKIVLIERDGNQRAIVIGSHNWTENALQGFNLEAGVIIHCQESDPIVAEVREHIEACLRRSEAFDRKRLRFYQAVQRDLHRGVGPGGQESEDFPGFEASEALVLHAEDGTPDGLPSPVQLFIPLRDRFAHRLFVEAPRVLLYLYPAGTLIGQTPPTASPIEHAGTVTMQNVVQDAPVTARAANCRISDLGAPRVELLPDGTVPGPSGETYQVVIRFDAKGAGELPVFHAAEQHPKMRLGVEYHVVDRDEGGQHVERRRHELSRGARAVIDESLPEYKAPRDLTVRAALRVPSQDLYRHQIRQQLTYVLTGTDFFDESTVLEPELRSPAARKMLNRYVYRVHFQLSEETMSRISKQMKLFDDL